MRIGSITIDIRADESHPGSGFLTIADATTGRVIALESIDGPACDALAELATRPRIIAYLAEHYGSYANAVETLADVQ